MNAEEFKERLEQIQNESSQTKLLNSILILANEIDTIGKHLEEMETKLNEVIDMVNSAEEKDNKEQEAEVLSGEVIEDADPVNTDITEDVIEAEVIDA